jgi:hypothetical protein
LAQEQVAVFLLYHRKFSIKEHFQAFRVALMLEVLQHNELEIITVQSDDVHDARGRFNPFGVDYDFLQDWEVLEKDLKVIQVDVDGFRYDERLKLGEHFDERDQIICADHDFSIMVDDEQMLQLFMSHVNSLQTENIHIIRLVVFDPERF